MCSGLVPRLSAFVEIKGKLGMEGPGVCGTVEWMHGALDSLGTRLNE